MAAEVAGSDRPLLVYIGTYTGSKSQGIYLARFQPATGRLSAPELAAETKNPSFLALHPNRPVLYAVGEIGNFEGKRTGAVSAFGIDEPTGKLTLLNQQSSGGAGPCYLAVDATGGCVLVANYGGGSVAVLPIEADGRLREPSMTVPHQGSSVNPQRQAGPHAHCTVPDPANRFALVCDLGLDKVLVYRLDPGKGALAPNDPPFVSAKPGSGPRHLAFHPNGRFVYVINEIKSTLTAYGYDAPAGVLKELQTVPMLPADFKADNICAEVQVHPSGRFVYGSSRGHDSIAAFAIDPKSGQLTFIERQSTQGKTPRHFALDPGGHWLLAENQDSDNVVIFQVDTESGRLRPTGQRAAVGAPACLVFVGAK